MSDHVTEILSVLLAALLPGIGTIWLYTLKLSSSISILQNRMDGMIPSPQIAAMGVKIDTLWLFQLRRGTMEGIEKSAITMNSPIKVESHIREVYSELIPELEAIAKTIDKKTDVELAAEIEKRLGDKLAREICPALKIQNGACLVIAVTLAKEAIGQHFMLNDMRVNIR